MIVRNKFECVHVYLRTMTLARSATYIMSCTDSGHVDSMLLPQQNKQCVFCDSYNISKTVLTMCLGFGSGEHAFVEAFIAKKQLFLASFNKQHTLPHYELLHHLLLIWIHDNAPLDSGVLLRTPEYITRYSTPSLFHLMLYSSNIHSIYMTAPRTSLLFSLCIRLWAKSWKQATEVYGRA